MPLVGMLVRAHFPRAHLSKLGISKMNPAELRHSNKIAVGSTSTATGQNIVWPVNPQSGATAGNLLYNPNGVNLTYGSYYVNAQNNVCPPNTVFDANSTHNVACWLQNLQAVPNASMVMNEGQTWYVGSECNPGYIANNLDSNGIGNSCVDVTPILPWAPLGPGKHHKKQPSNNTDYILIAGALVIVGIFFYYRNP
jgi:hypothetical protein